MSSHHRPAFDRSQMALVLVPATSVLVVMLTAASAGDVCYHRFADRRSLLGIPNFADVVSNLPFLLVGLFGIYHWRRNRPAAAPRSWFVFAAGVTAVSIGSAYYHWDPFDKTLIWDRLPMTVAFMALTVAMLSEAVWPKCDRFLLFPAIAIGIASVVFWYFAKDLRPYSAVQVTPIVVIPTVLLLYRKRCSHPALLLAALVFYLGAKVTESLDCDIFDSLNGVVSGHTLKHLLAALACFSIALMLALRPGGGSTPPAQA